MKQIINIAILAHVDAGKTSLTEQMLFHSGALKTVGNVDKGTATTDYLKVEKDRGISVTSSNVSFVYNSVQINIIDTPGHADFISEVERSLMVVDAVILLVSAADGVQVQTRSLWQLLDDLQIPRLILVNKVDRNGMILDDIIREIKQELSNYSVPLQKLLNEGGENANIVSLKEKYEESSFEELESLIEILADFDDNLLEDFLKSQIPNKEFLLKILEQKVKETKVYPILFSIAKTGMGIPELLIEIGQLFSANVSKENEDFSAVVFKISHHKQFNKLFHLRLFSGTLLKKQVIYNQRTKKEEKINLLKTVFSDKFLDLSQASSGDIVAVTGLANARVGDVLGHVAIETPFRFHTTPVLIVQVKAVKDEDYIKLAEALTLLNVEDPLLQFQWFRDEREFHIKINGWIQIEILKQILKDRFLLDANFIAPSIIYKETPKLSGIGKEEYTMPKPCWAVVIFKIEPGERGSGFVYQSDVGLNDILLKYQKEIERTIPLALEQGIKGWEVTDIKITLVGGEDHVVHSRAGDFVIATPMGIMNGLKDVDTQLLEPVMKFTLIGPEDILGQVTSDLVQMRGEFNQPEVYNGKMILKGKVPVASSIDYPVKLISRTGGRASIHMEFDSYQIVDDELGEIREFKGISPLDRAKYILKARKAIQ